ncbi:uracil-DNA glycosylase-like protein [Ephemerocybe angulata]|uniref:Uracil-DNA glycosylase-like protein n=1 Tax=Ephemerocybe angulata TaxID=980116 RepID=A0A8H6HUT1_9AGAR|nr:uracil-DNA glycosylase-like protein [Tulosesus angulatus]
MTSTTNTFEKLISGFAYSSKSNSKRKNEEDSQNTLVQTKRVKVELPREVSNKSPRHGVHDYLKPGLDVVFCGINPGEMSAALGHHFANPVNHFWACLHQGGFTPTLLRPSEDATLPERFNLGMTNLVTRSTQTAAELSKSELQSGVPDFLAKIALYKPKIVCFVGMGIADNVLEWINTRADSDGERKAKGKTKVKVPGPGLLPIKLVHSEEQAEEGKVESTLLYAVSSTSGRVVKYQKSDKIKQFQAVRALLDEINSSGSGVSLGLTPVQIVDLILP